jgi:pyridoxamine 5'-phosphate oxidase
MDMGRIRREYPGHRLRKDDVPADPITKLRMWWKEALESGEDEPNAMVLATASGEGRPTTRTVLLKGADERGFLFFTNLDSRKAGEIAENPWGGFTLLWKEPMRQVNGKGRIEQIPRAETEEYFLQRPRGSQIGAWASRQSQVIPSREFLVEQFELRSKEFEGRDVPCPQNWGGYRLVADEIEFWQGAPDRLHDRFCYRLQASGEWSVDRLSP